MGAGGGIVGEGGGRGERGGVRMWGRRGEGGGEGEGRG